MELAPILGDYREQFFQTNTRFPALWKEQKNALNAMMRCRTPACGEIQVYCPDCDHTDWFSHSCGHRSCPVCQHHDTTRWLNRQRKKLLPVDYFLVTFTLPAELRSVAKTDPKAVYNLLFQCASDTLCELAEKPRFLDGQIGMTGVLHTHSRKLDDHPHVHFIVPGVAFNPVKKLCRHSRNRFLLPGRVLGRLFKGKFLDGLKERGFSFPPIVYSKEWVVNCQAAGKGEPALKYLSRYLYRGVISERNILSHQDGEVTFRYTDSETKQSKIRTLPGVEFTNLILQHVLPRGFRRVRDYGFLHGNAKATLHQLQLLLQPKIRDEVFNKRPLFTCRCCNGKMQIIGVGIFRTMLGGKGRSSPGNK